MSASPPAIAAGTLTLYRFYDVGYAVDLAAAEERLARQTPRRHAPVRARQASSVEVAQPPLRVELGTAPVDLTSLAATGRLRASIYDLGAVAVAVEVDLPRPTDWPLAADLLAVCQDPPPGVEERFEDAI